MNKKTYVITGAASGIGRAVTERLCEDNIIFAGYRTDSKKEFLERLSPNIIPFYADYTKPETISEAAEFIKSKCTKIDTLINVAGCVIAGPVERLHTDEIRKQFEVNVFGHIAMTQGLAELLDNGRIINISSMASFGLFPFLAPYCASKKALDMFFNSFLLENKRNIKVISIKPGVIATPLWSKSVEDNSKHTDMFEGYEKEMKYVIKSAGSKEYTGLNVERAADVILKADSAKNPKLSYTVGGDAFLANIVAKLPQEIVNKIIKFGMKARIK